MAHPSSQQWAADVHSATAEILAVLTEIDDPSSYRLEVSACPAHGTSCMRITYAGAIVEHVAWHETEPASLARRLLLRMLPSHDDAGA